MVTGRTYLSMAGRVEIVRLRTQGLSYAEIGRRMGISGALAADVCKKKFTSAPRPLRNVNRAERTPEEIREEAKRLGQLIAQMQPPRLR